MNYLRLLELRRTAAMRYPDAGGASGADGGGKGAQGGADDKGKGTDGGTDEGGQKGEKSFTQADVDKIIREEQAKWMRQQRKAVSEAERLAKMSTEERAAEEEKARKEGLDKREAEITRRELRAQALEDLSAQNLPAELVDLLDYADADACSESIKKLKQTWEKAHGTWAKAVQAAVEERLKGAPPKAGSGKATGSKTMKDLVAEYYKK